MSLATDALDCLIEAIRKHHNVSLDPEDLNTLKPSDPEVGSQDASAWRRVLQTAVECLRRKGHAAGKPSRPRAGKLLSKELVDSQLYLEELARGSGQMLQMALTAGAVAISLGAAIAAVRALARRDDR